MNIPRSAGPLSSRRLLARPGRETVLKFRGINLAFRAGLRGALTPLLAAGRLKLVGFPDRVELRETIGGGKVRIRGRAEIDADNRVSVGGEPVQYGKAGHRVSAALFFPELGLVRRTNLYLPQYYRSKVVHEKMSFSLPTDPDSKYGQAVREERIIWLANRETIKFYEQTKSGQEEYIGAVELAPLRAGGRKNFNLAGLIEGFALKDIPIPIDAGHCHAIYRGVTFLFSHNQRGLYYRDFLAGRMFLRVGYADRVEVVRKRSDGEEVLGRVPLEALPAHSPRGKVKYFRVDRAIEELSGRDLALNLADFPEKANIHFNYLRFYFPMRPGNICREAISRGQLACRAYRRKIVIGWLEGERFREIGQLNFTKRNGYLLDGDGRPYLKNGQPVSLFVRRKLSISLASLIPQLNFLEKRPGPGVPGRIMHREILFVFDLNEGDNYYSELLAGRVIFRALGRRVEIYADRAAGGREYIGDFSLDAQGRLLTESGKIYRAKLGPVKAGQNRQVRITRLIGAFRPAAQGFAEVFELLAKRGYDDLYEEFAIHAAGRRWLKLCTLAGQKYLVDPAANEVTAVKMMSVLAGGLKKLAHPNQLSADLKQAFAREILETMATAFANPALAQVLDSLRMQYELALAAAARINQSC